MAPNTSPIFTLVPNIGRANITAANTDSSGSGTVGTSNFLAFTAGANGSWVSKVRFQAVATAAGTSTTATVARVFLSTKNSGSTTGGTDTFLLGEVALPIFTADSASSSVPPIDILLNIAIPTGMYILVTTHAAPAANTSQQASVFGGDF